MQDRPEFSITEFVLSALCVAGAAASLIYTARLVHDRDAFEAMQAGGLALVLLAAAFDPVHSLMDCLTFPFRVMEPSSYRTPLTVAASAVGVALSAAGWLLSLCAACRFGV